MFSIIEKQNNGNPKKIVFCIQTYNKSAKKMFYFSIINSVKK